METTPTATLAAFAAGLAPADLPGSARAMARDLLLDAVACALASDLSDETETYAAFARAVSGEGDATVIGSPERLAPLGAVLLNAYRITAATICDTYVPAHCHITPEIVPPALAMAEREGASGADLLAAVAVGSEVAVRVAQGLNYAVAGPRGWHMPGVVGPFGAAAATGRLIGLDAGAMRHALGLAGSQSAGTWASWGTPTVKFHQSRGAASGLLAGLLARTGFAASAEVLTHKDGGLLHAYSDGGRPEALTDRLGEHWEFEEIALRLWPGGTPLQPALTAAFALIARGVPDLAALASVRIAVAPDVHEAHARFHSPKGTFEALLSFPFAVASALRDRRFDLASMAGVADPALAAIMAERVRLEPDPSLTRTAARIEVETADGRSLSARCDAAKGTRGNPATAEELGRKFRACAQGRLSDTDAAELLDRLAGLGDQRDLSRLLALLAAAGPRRA